MSKPVKNLIVESYKRRFEGVTGAVVVDIRGIASNDNNKFRETLAQKQIKVTVVKNSLARRAFEGTEMTDLGEMLEGSSAMVYPVGEDVSVVSVARELIGMVKQLPNLTFKGALMDGIRFGPDEIDALSKYPTREEAQAKVVQVLLSPGRNLAGAIAGPGGRIASILKTIQDKLEKGETIAKVA
jgi:large subunit ribosomal protein L10